MFLQHKPLTSLQQCVEQGGVGEEEEVAKGLGGEWRGQTGLPRQHQRAAVDLHQSSHFGWQGRHVVLVPFFLLSTLCTLTVFLVLLLVFAGEGVGVQECWQERVQSLWRAQRDKVFGIPDSHFKATHFYFFAYTAFLTREDQKAEYDTFQGNVL